MRLLLMTGAVFAGFGWAQSDAPNDPIKTLVGRLDLEHYKGDHQGADQIRRPPRKYRPKSRGR